MRMRLALLALTAAALLPAQTIPLAPARDTTPAVHIAHYPNPSTAIWLSLGATLVPVGAAVAVNANSSSGLDNDLFFSGLVIGPAAGFWHGGVSGRAWPGLLIRGGGLAIYSIATSGCNGNCSQTDQIVRGSGIAIIVASAIYDIATVGKKVRANNSALARAMVVPLFSPSEHRFGAAIIVGF
jgi:hypothetical protein